ncbi:MAG: hypothetical protein AAB070_06195, partial [Candidatus Binatota bacterium]
PYLSPQWIGWIHIENHNQFRPQIRSPRYDSGGDLRIDQSKKDYEYQGKGFGTHSRFSQI